MLVGVADTVDEVEAKEVMDGRVTACQSLLNILQII